MAALRNQANSALALLELAVSRVSAAPGTR
jgi:hypothetical protein